MLLAVTADLSPREGLDLLVAVTFRYPGTNTLTSQACARQPWSAVRPGGVPLPAVEARCRLRRPNSGNEWRTRCDFHVDTIAMVLAARAWR